MAMTPLGAGSGHRRPSPLAGPVQAGADQLRGQPGRPRAGGGRHRTRPGAQPRRGPAGLLLDWERPDELWAVTDQGNLWRSNDAGASWRRAGKIDGQPEAFLAQNSACMWRWPTRHRDLDRPGPQLAGAVPGSPTGRIAARQSGGRDRDAGRTTLALSPLVPRHADGADRRPAGAAQVHSTRSHTSPALWSRSLR